MNIIVNGIREKFENNTLLQYLDYKKINKNSVVIEHNGKILKKEEIDNIILNESDKIEIIRFIGGG